MTQSSHLDSNQINGKKNSILKLLTTSYRFRFFLFILLIYLAGATLDITNTNPGSRFMLTKEIAQEESFAIREEVRANYSYLDFSVLNQINNPGFENGEGEDAKLIEIDNKQVCESAGGQWLVDTYCEGNISIPTGRCERKFDEERNCNKACFACEFMANGSNYASVAKAQTACEASEVGCEFESDTSAPNGFGFCEVKDAIKFIGDVGGGGGVSLGTGVVLCISSATVGEGSSVAGFSSSTSASVGNSTGASVLGVEETAADSPATVQAAKISAKMPTSTINHIVFFLSI